MLGWEAARGERRVEGWEGAARGAERAGWMSAHFGPLLSEVALAVDFKEEVSWQKEKIEAVVQFPPINNPGGHSYLLVGGSACSPGGALGSSPSVGVVISEAFAPSRMKGRTGHLHHHLGRGQSGPPSPGEHRRQRLGPFREAGRQAARWNGVPPVVGNLGRELQRSLFSTGNEEVGPGAGEAPRCSVALPTCVLLCSQTVGTAQGLAKCQFQVGPGGPWWSCLRSQENKVQISDQALVSGLPSSL